MKGRLDDMFTQKRIDDVFESVASTRPKDQKPLPNTFLSLRNVPKGAEWNCSDNYPSNQNCAVRIYQPPIPLQMVNRSMNCHRPKLSSHVHQVLQREMFQSFYIHSQMGAKSDMLRYYDSIVALNSDSSGEWCCMGSGSSGTIRLFNINEWQSENFIPINADSMLPNENANLGMRLSFRNQADHGFLSNIQFCMGGYDKFLVSFSNRSYILLYDVNKISDFQLSHTVSFGRLNTEQLKQCYTLIPTIADVFDFDFLDNQRRDILVCGLRTGNLQLIDLRQKNHLSVDTSTIRKNTHASNSTHSSMTSLNNPRSGFGIIGSKNKKKKKIIGANSRVQNNYSDNNINSQANNRALPIVSADGSINCVKVNSCGDLVFSGSTKGKLKLHDIRYLVSSENTVHTIDVPQSILAFEKSMRNRVHLLRDHARYANFKKRIEMSLNSNRRDYDPQLEEIEDFGAFSYSNHSRINSNHSMHRTHVEKENSILDSISLCPNNPNYIAFIMGNGKRVGYMDLLTGNISKLYTTNVINNISNTNSVRTIKGCFLSTPGCHRNLFFCVPSLNAKDDYITVLDWSLQSIEELYDETDIDLLCGIKSSADCENRTMKITTNCGKGSAIRPACALYREKTGDILCGTTSDSLLCLKTV